MRARPIIPASFIPPTSPHVVSDLRKRHMASALRRSQLEARRRLKVWTAIGASVILAIVIVVGLVS